MQSLGPLGLRGAGRVSCALTRSSSSAPGHCRHPLALPSPFVRPLTPSSVESGTILQDDFALYPDTFTLEETEVLARGALFKLDRVDSKLRRRRRGSLAGVVPDGHERRTAGSNVPLQHLFDKDYGFEAGHFDAVIHDYRESTITNLPPLDTFADFGPILSRAFALLPSSPPSSALQPRSNLRMEPVSDTLPKATITHLLHLAPSGEILPHVDNLDASGTLIMGICLGATRILRLEHKENKGEGWEVLLTNGTVYLQKDSLRYAYEHSILPYSRSEWDGTELEPGHRISIMVRDTPTIRSA